MPVLDHTAPDLASRHYWKFVPGLVRTRQLRRSQLRNHAEGSGDLRMPRTRVVERMLGMRELRTSVILTAPGGTSFLQKEQESA